MTENLQRTALFEAHKAAGARIVPFAGWEMPVQYAGVIGEVRAVRESCGLFDVSHMAQFDVSGQSATEKLNGVVSADWSQVAPNRVAYALFLTENGGVLDDAMGYHLGEDKWLVVANASRADVDEPHLRAHLPGVNFSNRYENQAMLAIQGPKSEEILRSLAEIPDLKWRDCVEVEILGSKGLLARGGYTGSDGFEFMFSGDDAPRIWDAFVAAGVIPCGLGARDVLRLEAALPLYGHEMREEWTPFESGAGWAVKNEKGDFVGKKADVSPPTRRIFALQMEGKAIPREGYPVVLEGETVGEVTSGTLSPTLGAGIALAMLPASLQIGESVEISIRGALHAAKVVKRPFVAHANR